MVMEVLLRAAVDDLARSKKIRDWVLMNDFLLPPFLTEKVVLDDETSAT